MEFSKIVEEYARDLHALIVEDDLVTQAIYEEYFGDLFGSYKIVSNGVEALEYFNEKKEKIDLIITDTYMPKMTGLELVKKIREKDFNVKVIVITGETDLNQISSYTLSGVDAIIPKPIDYNTVNNVLHRVLHSVNESKVLDAYTSQLEAMARDNISRKSQELKKKTINQEIKPVTKEKKQDISLVDKYKVRASTTHIKEDIDLDNIDIFNEDKIEAFKEDVSSYEIALMNAPKDNIELLRETLKYVLGGLSSLTAILNGIGAFKIASSAAKNLVDFVANLSDDDLKNIEKNELFVDILITILGDFDKWIDAVFISKTAKNNVNYFDASFANTCLELEMIFKEEKKTHNEDEDALEFF
jgi:YesN/AraC family two-component response regulator